MPPGYSLLRQDRILSWGGGVALLFREDIIMYVVHSSTEKVFVIPRESKAEYWAANALHPRFVAILVIIVYHFSRTAHFDGFFAEIEDLLSVIDRWVLMGDFNYNLQNIDQDAADFVQKLTSLGLHLPRFYHTCMDHHVTRSWIFWLSLVSLSSSTKPGHRLLSGTIFF